MVWLMLVSRLVIVTVALGINAFCASFTEPTSAAFCAASGAATRNRNANPVTTDFGIEPPYIRPACMETIPEAPDPHRGVTKTQGAIEVYLWSSEMGRYRVNKTSVARAGWPFVCSRRETGGLGYE